MVQKATVPRICKFCGGEFLARKHDVKTGGGHYCSKLCWSRHYNKPKIIGDEPRRARAKRPKKCPLDGGKLGPPFQWAKEFFKRNRFGSTAKAGKYYSAYGPTIIVSMRIPIEIATALENIGRLRSVSVSRLISGLVANAIWAGPHADQLKRHPTVLMPAPPRDKLFDWTDEGIRKLDDMYIAVPDPLEEICIPEDQQGTSGEPSDEYDDGETYNQREPEQQEP